jgi:hypothetical protein
MALSDPAMTTVLKVRIGGVSVSIEGDVSKGRCESALPYEPFFRDGKPDVRLCLHRGRFDTSGSEKVFECPPIWSLYRRNGRSFLEIFSDLPGLERTLVLLHSRESADLYFSDTSDRFIDPFFGPTLELLMVHTLARGRGIILHGSGIAMGERGILFIGESGAGKSTLANLWHRRRGVRVLSDDRVIVRKEGGRFLMYGTPWHGTARFGLPDSAPIERILFLRHGSRNAVTEVKGIAATAKLLSCSFPPHWDASGMAFTLELLHELVAQHPCGEFSFRPDKNAVEFLVAEWDGGNG